MYEAPVRSQLMSGPGPGPVRTTLSLFSSLSSVLSCFVRRVISTAHCPRLPWPGTVIHNHRCWEHEGCAAAPRPRPEGYVTPRVKVDSRCGRVCNLTLPVCPCTGIRTVLCGRASGRTEKRIERIKCAKREAHRMLRNFHPLGESSA